MKKISTHAKYSMILNYSINSKEMTWESQDSVKESK